MASDIELKAYELGYLLSPLVAGEQMENVFNATFKNKLEKLGGGITGELAPKTIPLAYTVSKSINNKNVKFNEAYFGAFRFELDPAAVADLKVAIDKTDEVLRFLLMKLDKRADKTQLRARLPERRNYYAVPSRTEIPEHMSEEKIIKPIKLIQAPTVDKGSMSEADIDREIEGLLEETK